MTFLESEMCKQQIEMLSQIYTYLVKQRNEKWMSNSIDNSIEAFLGAEQLAKH